MIDIAWMLIAGVTYSYAIGNVSNMFANSMSRSQLNERCLYILEEFSEETGLGTKYNQEFKQVLQFNQLKNILSDEEKEEFFSGVPLTLQI